jgi:hypothetical protein
MSFFFILLTKDFSIHPQFQYHYNHVQGNQVDIIDNMIRKQKKNTRKNKENNNKCILHFPSIDKKKMCCSFYCTFFCVAIGSVRCEVIDIFYS